MIGGQIVREQILNPETANNTKHSKHNYPGLVTFYDTQPGNEVGLFYDAPEPTRGNDIYQGAWTTTGHWPECKLRFEDGLSLQSGALTYKQMVEVALQLHDVNVKDLVAEVQRQATGQRPPSK